MAFFLIERGMQYMRRFSWKVPRKKDRKCSNISVKKYLKKKKHKISRFFSYLHLFININPTTNVFMIISRFQPKNPQISKFGHRHCIENSNFGSRLRTQKDFLSPNALSFIASFGPTFSHLLVQY